MQLRFANLEKTIGHMVAVNEGELQAFVSSDTPLSKLLSEDVPAVAAAKKDLEQLFRKHSQCQGTLDKEQRRLDKMQAAAAAAEEGDGTGAADPEALAAQREKRDRTAHELDMLAKDVQLDQDRLASTLLTLTARENRYAQSVYEIMRIKKQFYENAYKTIEAELPNIQRLLEDTNVRPVFGETLEDHLKASGRRIALPVALSVACLLESGLEDEGLFRISAKQIKIDKFKAALDSRASVADLLAEGDPHLHASLLKSYLRELPQPLLGGGAVYDRWVRSARLPGHSERMAEFRDILRSEHSAAARDNIQYVVKFLHELSSKSEETKMTPRNISIVMGPTLLWSSGRSSSVTAPAATASEQLLEQSNLESVIGVVAQLIEHQEEVFDFCPDMNLCLEEDDELNQVRMEALRIAEASKVFDAAAAVSSPLPSSTLTTACHPHPHPPPPPLSASSFPPPDRPPPPANLPPSSSLSSSSSSVMSSSLTVPYSSISSSSSSSSSGIVKGLSPESPSPNQRRKPSIRGVGGRLMNNPVGRNIMSKIGHGSSSSSSSSSRDSVQYMHSSAPATPPTPSTTAAAAVGATAAYHHHHQQQQHSHYHHHHPHPSTQARRSLPDNFDEGLEEERDKNGGAEVDDEDGEEDADPEEEEEEVQLRSHRRERHQHRHQQQQQRATFQPRSTGEAAAAEEDDNVLEVKRL